MSGQSEIQGSFNPKRLIPYAVAAAVFLGLWIANNRVKMVVIFPPLFTTNSTDIVEARRLMALLNANTREAKDLLLQERTIANQLKVTLDELAPPEQQQAEGQPAKALTGDPKQFRSRLKLYLQEMIAVKAGRENLLRKIEGFKSSSDLVFGVQQDAITYLQHELERTEGWISAARNVELRAELGRERQFPELPVLSKRLDNFLTEPFRDPLAEQVLDLIQEFRTELSE